LTLFLPTERALITNKNFIYIALAIIVLAVTYLIPTPEGLNQNGKMMIGILLVGIILWTSEAIPLAVTGLLIIILQPILGVAKPIEVFSSFGNTAIFFLIGAFILAAGIEKHNIHKRIALHFLKGFEDNPKLFSFGIMLCSALLSFIIPEHAVAALMMPIILSIFLALNVVPRVSNFGKLCMLSIAYGCSIGSLGTLVGGARNPVTLGFLQETQNVNLTFVDWMKYSMPIVFISLPIVWLVLIILFPIEIKNLSKAKKMLDKEVRDLGEVGSAEGTTLAILIGTIFGWVFLSTLFPENWDLAIIAILGSIALFFSGTIEWKDVEQRVPWGIIFLYGGAITLGVGLINTGAAGWLADHLLGFTNTNPVLVIIVLIVITVLLTQVMSNTAAVVVLLPIGVGLGAAADLSPLITSLIIALSGGLAFVLIIATPGNAITYTAGYYSTRDLFKAGLISAIICMLIVFIIAITYWRLIGVW
jgi:sodium-dependent dicarboxylate transporter 2/3/5